MAFTVRGFGALNYGQREFRPDGSYVTTLWVVCLYVPVIPLHSKRIRPTGEVKYYALFPRRTYSLLQKTKPNLKQVASIYAWFGAELAIFVTAKVLQSWLIAVPGILLIGLPFLLRKGALNRMRAETIRKEMGFTPELSD
jgi:hypothetical protein